MEYVTPKYEAQLDHLADTLMTAFRERLGTTAVNTLSEDEQIELSITRTREECIAEEEAKLGKFTVEAYERAHPA